jgi:hypothetical protein
MKAKLKVAYVIRSGEMTNGIDVSSRLRSPGSLRKAIRAAKRMGFKNAYGSKMMVNSDCKLR